MFKVVGKILLPIVEKIIKKTFLITILIEKRMCKYFFPHFSMLTKNQLFSAFFWGMLRFYSTKIEDSRSGLLKFRDSQTTVKSWKISQEFPIFFFAYSGLHWDSQTFLVWAFQKYETFPDCLIENQKKSRKKFSDQSWKLAGNTDFRDWDFRNSGFPKISVLGFSELQDFLGFPVFWESEPHPTYKPSYRPCNLS